MLTLKTAMKKSRNEAQRFIFSTIENESTTYAYKLLTSKPNMHVMVGVSVLPHAKFGSNGHKKDGPNFIVD